VARATRHSVLLVLPAGLVVALLLTAVPLVYGGKFDETVALGFVLLPGVLVLGVGKVLGSVVSGRGGPHYMLYTGALGAVVTIVLYLALIPPYHEWGASAASSFSYAFTTVIVLAFFRRATGIPLRTALIPTRADVRNYVEAFNALRLHRRSRRAERQAA
jgi:O-antigen/teichoic acid export membrane protein